MLKSLQYASELETLGYSCSLPGFESCNKLELVMGIWRSQSNNPQAVVLIARLCVEFGIQQHNIWTLLLKQMTKYSMVSAHCLLHTCIHFSLALSLYATTFFEQSWSQFFYTISAGTADILSLNRTKCGN
jgi:hypothetical protein